jgi:superfamily I DNA and/or RNA helicase
LQHQPAQKKLEIGIITFYAAQVTIITQQIGKSGIGMNNSLFKLKVVSVDGYQGSEADIIILSFVRSNHRRSVGFLKDFQRLNVALTRAKHHLVMLGDVQTLEKSDCEDLQNLIVEMRSRKVLVEKEHIFSLDAAWP